MRGASSTPDELLAKLNAAASAKSKFTIYQLMSYDSQINHLPTSLNQSVMDSEKYLQLRAYLLLLRLIDNSIDSGFNQAKAPKPPDFALSTEELLRYLGPIHEGPLSRADLSQIKDPELRKSLKHLWQRPTSVTNK